MKPLLKLLVDDPAELTVVAAALQDSLTQIGEVRYERRAQRVTIVFNRYRWESDRPERVRSGLQIGSVRSVQGRRLRRRAKDGVIDLLDLSFVVGEAPGGELILRFAGGGDLCIVVECLDLILADIGEPWPSPRKPNHKA